MQILIADYHALLRDGLSILVKELDAAVEVAQREDLDGVMAALAAAHTDLVLIDSHLPEFDGPRSIRLLRERFPDLHVVMLAADERWSDACAAIEAGAHGYIPKSASSALMLAALRLILSGGVYVPSPISRAAGQGAPTGFIPRLGNGLPEPMDHRLTPRQLDVLRCLARGQSNKEIAYQLGLSQGTVKIHIAAIFRVFKVRNRTQAVIAAGFRPT